MWTRTINHTWHGLGFQILQGVFFVTQFLHSCNISELVDDVSSTTFLNWKFSSRLKVTCRRRTAPSQSLTMHKGREVWFPFQLTIIASTLRFMSSHNTPAGCFISILVKDCRLILSSHCLFNIQIFYFPGLELFM